MRDRQFTWSCDKFTNNPLDDDYIGKLGQFVLRINIARTPFGNWDPVHGSRRDPKVAAEENRVNTHASYVNSRNKKFKRMSF